jgi:hypothetical protein
MNVRLGDRLMRVLRGLRCALSISPRRPVFITSGHWPSVKLLPDVLHICPGLQDLWLCLGCALFSV